MDFVVYLALGVLAAVFLVSLVVLILMCKRRQSQMKQLAIFNPNLRFSKLRNESVDILQLSPMMAQVLDKNAWVYDVSGVLQHCVALLRLSHQLSERLHAISMDNAPAQLTDIVNEATNRIMPRFDDLLSSVASPAIDVRILEARATALASVCWALYLPFSLIKLQKDSKDAKENESITQPLEEMEQHLAVLRQAAVVAERAELGKVEIDWNGLDELDHETDDDDGPRSTTVTMTDLKDNKLNSERTPLVDRSAYEQMQQQQTPQQAPPHRGNGTTLVADSAKPPVIIEMQPKKRVEPESEDDSASGSHPIDPSV